jgi:hypothetical protein
MDAPEIMKSCRAEPKAASLSGECLRDTAWDAGCGEREIFAGRRRWIRKYQDIGRQPNQRQVDLNRIWTARAKPLVRFRGASRRWYAVRGPSWAVSDTSMSKSLSGIMMFSDRVF